MITFKHLKSINQLPHDESREKEEIKCKVRGRNEITNMRTKTNKIEKQHNQENEQSQKLFPNIFGFDTKCKRKKKS